MFLSDLELEYLVFDKHPFLDEEPKLIHVCLFLLFIQVCFFYFTSRGRFSFFPTFFSTFSPFSTGFAIFDFKQLEKKKGGKIRNNLEK